MLGLQVRSGGVGEYTVRRRDGLVLGRHVDLFLKRMVALLLYCLSPLHIMTDDCVTARAVCLKLKCGLPLAQHDASDDLVFKPRTLCVGIPARTARGEAVLYLGGGNMSVFTLKIISLSMSSSIVRSNPLRAPKKSHLPPAMSLYPIWNDPMVSTLQNVCIALLNKRL